MALEIVVHYSFILFFFYFDAEIAYSLPLSLDYATLSFSYVLSFTYLLSTFYLFFYADEDDMR
jgi:NADH:ubiquinone oxidoreductase subunit 3 (subunit A)